jgi:protein-L-isoaspartate(D-aspartate) O-methyltransferase
MLLAATLACAVSPGTQRVTPDWEFERRRMVEEQLRRRDITSARVLDAMGQVPRHLFVPEPLRADAYVDSPLPIGLSQTISQPYIVAFMTQALDVASSHRVLEIGTGSGYQAAILAELVDRVFSMERLAGLAKRARRVLDELKYTNVILRIADGTEGWRDEAPFDGIVVAAAAPDAPDPLLKQLTTGGKLVIPIGDEQFQDLMVYTKEGEDRYKEENYGGCRFVKLIGQHGWKG